MDTRNVARVLEGHLRAQFTLLKACRGRAMAGLGAGNPDLSSAWIGHVVALSNAMAASGSAIAAFRHAAGEPVTMLSHLRLPDLPALPEEGGGAPLRERGRKEIAQTSPAQRPQLRTKSKGGAPKGNRNAQKSGCHTAAFHAFGRDLNIYTRTLRAELALLSTLVPRSPQRVIYLVQTPTRCYARTARQGRSPQPARARDIETRAVLPFVIGPSRRQRL